MHIILAPLIVLLAYMDKIKWLRPIVNFICSRGEEMKHCNACGAKMFVSNLQEYPVYNKPTAYLCPDCWVQYRHFSDLPYKEKLRLFMELG